MLFAVDLTMCPADLTRIALMAGPGAVIPITLYCLMTVVTRQQRHLGLFGDFRNVVYSEIEKICIPDMYRCKFN